MTTCHCPMCSDDPAETYTPEYMRACLVRTVARRTPGEIKAFLARWTDRHPADTKIRDEVAAEWRALRDGGKA